MTFAWAIHAAFPNAGGELSRLPGLARGDSVFVAVTGERNSRGPYAVTIRRLPEER